MAVLGLGDIDRDGFGGELCRVVSTNEISFLPSPLSFFPSPFLTPHSLSLALSSPFPPSLLISPLSCRVDFAVSSPYEPDGDSTGVVYVYYGSGDLDLFRSQTPVRVRSGERGER